MTVAEFGIGDIVGLTSHPYFRKLSAIIIAGDPLSISPLFVVVEIIKFPIRDPNDATLVIKRKPDLNKCIWFSNKTNSFEEAWIASNQLKLIKANGDLSWQKKLVGTQNLDTTLSVVLKTMAIELGKQKSSITKDEYAKNGDDNLNTTISSLLTSVSPLMEIQQVFKNEGFEKLPNKIDTATGIQRKFASNWLVKCKWFNSGNARMTESLIPIEALLPIKSGNESLLRKIHQAIGKNKYLQISSDVEIPYIMVKPLYIFFKGGNYFLKAFDYVRNHAIEVDLLDIDFKVKKTYFKDKTPSYDFFKPGRLYNDVFQQHIDLLKLAKKKKLVIRIKYIKGNRKVTHRSLKDFSVHIYKSKGKETFYLSGYCFLKKEERTFKSSNIQKIEILHAPQV